MKSGNFAGALALACSLVASAAFADDPNDPAMRSAAARARDHATIKRLNEQQLAYVRQRDAGYAQGWDDYRNRGGDGGSSAAQLNRAARDEYEHRMAEWRHAVAACNAGHYEYCQR